MMYRDSTSLIYQFYHLKTYLKLFHNQPTKNFNELVNTEIFHSLYKENYPEFLISKTLSEIYWNIDDESDAPSLDCLKI